MDASLFEMCGIACKLFLTDGGRALLIKTFEQGRQRDANCRHYRHARYCRPRTVALIGPIIVPRLALTVP
jgi:hypothetical protein